MKPDHNSTPYVLFKWKGIDEKGIYQRGSCWNVSSKRIQEKLKQQNIFLISARATPTWLMQLTMPKIKPVQITEITQQIAELMRAGIPIAQTLEALSENQNSISVQSLLQHLAELLNSGESVTHAFSQYPNYFNKTYLHLLKAGELTGTLEQLFSTLAQEQKAHQAMLKKIKGALHYPCTVLCLGIILSLILITQVLPQLENLYQNFESSLPWLTQSLLDLSQFIEKQSLINLSFPGLIIMVTIKTCQNPRIKKPLRRFLEHIPMGEKFFRPFMLYYFFRTCSLGYKSGLSIIETLDLTTQAYSHQAYQKYCIELKHQLLQGRSLCQSMKSLPLFPIFTQRMIQIGESTGGLDQTFQNLHIIYQKQLNDRLEAFSLWVEPCMMIIVALLIGTLIVGMYLPIFQLADVIH